MASVPINKPATSILLALSLAGSLAGVGLRERVQAALREPVVRGCLLWWCVLALSAIHAGLRGDWRGFGDSGLWVFCYPLIFAATLDTASWRWRALTGFALAVALVLCVSYAMQWGWLPQRERVGWEPALSNTVFKEYTQQGLSTLVLAAMAVAVAFWTRSSRVRLAMAAVAVAALVGVTVLLQSRTSYLALAPLTVYWVVRAIRAHRRFPLWAAATAGAALVSVAALTLSQTPQIERRLLVSVSSELHRYERLQEPTSAGIRLRLWQETLPIVAAAPVFGHGFGQWRALYAQRMAAIPNAAPFVLGHPHQEFLLVLAEEGAAGLAIWLLLILALWRRIAALPDPQRGLFASVVLIYLSAGLFNGLWSDFTHRHMFVLLLACIPFDEPRARVAA